MSKKELGRVFWWDVPLRIRVLGPLYASSATTEGGIVAALEKNKPTEAQLTYRLAQGEPITSLEDLKVEIIEETSPVKELVPQASTVWRRDKEGRPFVHANFIKGHLREAGEIVSRLVGFWGLKKLITQTVTPTPSRLYLEGEIQLFRTHFAPDVRLKGGVEVRQATEKVEEFVDSPVLDWVLYLTGDPRWNRDLLEDILIQGSFRGLGPGRARDESKYTFDLGNFTRVARPPIEGWGG